LELKPVYALSIAGRLTLEMHSLNNEGGEGNQITTRMVTLVDADGEVHTVNAISGDMFKHIHAEHLQRLAKSQGLPLCAGCHVFSSSRVLDDKSFMDSVEGKKDSQAIDALLPLCVIDDAQGVLIAKSNQSIPRKSVAEFGWVVGLPGTKTDSYFHVRYAHDRGGDEKTSQPIFHRPANSGIYAVVVSLEVARLGFNDITQTYPVNEVDRLARYKALLESTLYTFVKPAGAMRSMQYPHIYDFRGVVTVSRTVQPAPLLSPLNRIGANGNYDYREEIQRVAAALDNTGESIVVYSFDSMGEFAQVMRQLLDTTRPYSLFSS
jgi:CRISPR-associated protein Cst2